MRRKTQLIAILVGWSLATGAHWDLIQAFAWGRMFATYVQSMPVIRAAEMTMDPGNMCSVCKAVSKAREQDHDSSVPGGRPGSKVTLIVHSAAPVILGTESGARWTCGDSSPCESPSYRPPLPPPRWLA